MEGKVSRAVPAVFVFTVLLFATASAGAGVTVGIHVPPPRVAVPAQPVVVLIPGTYAYFIPDMSAEIIFYHGYWYRPHEGRWYRAKGYNGPWVYLVPKKVPSVLLRLPQDYRTVPPGHERIPYGQLKKNWKDWERKKYWDRRASPLPVHPDKPKGKGKPR